jgi:hypothetical protein
MEYDQRMIIKSLLNVGSNTRDITDRLHAQFGEYAYKLRTIEFWITEVWLGRQHLHNENRTRRPPLDDFDAKILVILDKYPFESTSSIAGTLCVVYSTVLLHLHDSIGFVLFHLHWVQHLVTHDLREKRKEHAKTMFLFLYVAKRDIWHHIMTNDESWFFLNKSSRYIWTLSRDDVVTKSRLDI